MLNIGAIKKFIFLTFNAKKTFNYMKQAFIKALIFFYFNLESYIETKIDVSGYTIARMLK